VGYRVWKFFPLQGVAMDHSEFGNELEHEVKFIFEELDKFIVSQFETIKPNSKFRKNKFLAIRKAERGSYEEKIRYRNSQDKRELLEEQEIIIRLYKMDINIGQAINRMTRLRALKVVQKKIEFSIERYEMELPKSYRYFLAPYAVFLFLIIFAAFAFSPESAADIYKKLIPLLTIGSVLGALSLFLLKTIFDNVENSILIPQKRRLELIEQAIELAQANEHTNE
jgi:hypothetical protein